MPLTPIQREILRTLAKNRSPESFLAGGTAINLLPDSPRYSQDIDIFHDLVESVKLSAETDAATLTAAGFSLKWQLTEIGFHRAMAERAADSTKIEWTKDAAYRFFPIESDPDMGYRLHLTDLATNKLLALAGRAVARDLIDVVYLHEHHLHLAGICWAACGKDPGFTPELLLNEASRHAQVRPEELEAVPAPAPIDLRDLKIRWLRALENAQEIIAQLPTDELGCLYLNGDGVAVCPPVDPAKRASLTRHFGTVRGAWPAIP